MATELSQVVQEVVIDDSQATQGAARVATAMDTMATASDQATAANQRQVTGLAALDAAIAKATPAQTSAQRALERWTAAADPAVAAQQRLARAEADLTRAVQQGIATEAQKAQVLEQLSVRYGANVAANEALARSGAGLAAANDTVTRGWALNRQGLLSLQASGVNAFQALASGMSPWRVAQSEGAQVLGALVQGGLEWRPSWPRPRRCSPPAPRPSASSRWRRAIRPTPRKTRRRPPNTPAIRSRCSPMRRSWRPTPPTPIAMPSSAATMSC